MGKMSAADEYWLKFIKETGRSEEDKCAGDLHFQTEKFRSDQLISLILADKKTAFFTSWATYAIDREPLPVSGELYIVFDRSDAPRCVIETESVNVIPFNEATCEMAEREGEDENLGAWKLRQQENLEDEGSVLGFEFTPDIKLVFQTFRVVYR